MVQEIYFSTDIESDGPIPGPNSMLSFASVAFDEVGRELGSFSRNLEQLPGASPDDDTMSWWEDQPEAWKACRRDLVSPTQAMTDYIKWIRDVVRGAEKKTGGSCRAAFVAYPAGFDFLYIYWYLIRFVGKSPFSFSAIDVKTFAMAVLKTSYHKSSKRQMPKAWFKGQPKHTHIAEDDARGQGMLFIAMLKESRS